MSGKLYLVTRADLRHGSQAAQLVHGMATFASDYPLTFEEWERTSNIVVCLTVPDEKTLWHLKERAEQLSDATEDGLPVSTFVEPDLDNELTCVVLAPIDSFAELCVGFPLACR